MNRKVQFSQTGNHEVLEIIQVPVPTPGKGEVVVKMQAYGLNRAEQLFYQGYYLVTPQLPNPLGMEGAGMIHATGEEAGPFVAGDRVSVIPGFDITKYGVLGDYALIPGEALIKLPENFTMIDGASIWMSYLTAYTGLIQKGGLKSKTSPFVVISAASSAVGLSAIQIAKRYQATVIATTRTSAKKKFLLENGADEVIATQEEDFVETIMKITGQKGFDMAFDPLAGSFLNTLSKAAAYEASIVVYGGLSMEETPYPLYPAIAKGLNLSSLHVHVNLIRHPDLLKEATAEIFSGFKEGVYKPVIDRTFNLEDIREAYQYLESGSLTGKVVIENNA